MFIIIIIIDTFSQKIKIPKIMSKCFLQVIYNCSVKKTAWKDTKYSRNETILKIRYYAKPIDCKIVALGQKLKFQNTCQNLVYKWFTLVRCKNPPEKTRNIRVAEWDENWPTSKAYSLLKIITMVQRFKLKNTCQNLFYKWFKVVLCKNLVEKTLRIPKVRRF